MAGFKQYVDYDVDLENSVLGVFILEPTALGAFMGLLTEECFYDQGNQSVYKKMLQVFKTGDVIDLMVITRAFYSEGITEINNVNAGYYLTKLCDGVVSSAHMHKWCLLLRELAAKREMIALTSSGIGDKDVLENAADIEKRLKKILDVRSSDDWVHISQVSLKASKHLDEAAGKEVIGVSTSISLLDKINGGFRPSQMIVIGARPSVGKSAFMGRIATQAAFRGSKVGIISLEMEDKDIFNRLTASESGIPFYQIDHNDLDEEQHRKRVYDTMSSLAALPIYFSDTAQVNIWDIRAKTEKLKRKHGLDLLIIDYLQLIEPESEKGRNREQEVSRISRGIKILAMNLKIPIIILAQLNRQIEGKKGDDAKPLLHHLRESGSIEQDADVVMFLHRDYMSGIIADEHGNSTEDKADLLVRKWRNGAPMEVKLGFEKETMRFYEPEQEMFKKSTSFEQQHNPYAGMPKTIEPPF